MAEAVELEASWGRHRLPFRMRRADVKRLRIVVDPHGGIHVTAPMLATDEAVVVRVSRRGDWIRRQQEQFARWRPRTPVRQYLDGETHLFLGRQLRLQIEHAAQSGVSIEGRRLTVRLEAPGGRGAVRQLVQAWYAAQARVILRTMWNEQRRHWSRHGVNVSRLIVRTLKNRWGSMTPAGNLVLNADLVRASPNLIDYVIAHELAHVVHPDHGFEWRALMGRVVPDWMDRKRELELQLL
jgi:predicted metal-dependent hydrolase